MNKEVNGLMKQRRIAREKYKEQVKENIELKKKILDYQLRDLESKGE